MITKVGTIQGEVAGTPAPPGTREEPKQGFKKLLQKIKPWLILVEAGGTAWYAREILTFFFGQDIGSNQLYKIGIGALVVIAVGILRTVKIDTLNSRPFASLSWITVIIIPVLLTTLTVYPGMSLKDGNWWVDKNDDYQIEHKFEGVWVVNFKTNNTIHVPIFPGDRFIISATEAIKLEWPTMGNPKEYLPVPLNREITNKIFAKLPLRGEANKSITIKRF